MSAIHNKGFVSFIIVNFAVQHSYRNKELIRALPIFLYYAYSKYSQAKF